MKKTENNDPVTGNFIFAKNIVNDGRFISKGKRPVNYIQTENYSGKGLVQSKQINIMRDKWHQSSWGVISIGLFVTVVGGLILYFFTK